MVQKTNSSGRKWPLTGEVFSCANANRAREAAGLIGHQGNGNAAAGDALLWRKENEKSW